MDEKQDFELEAQAEEPVETENIPKEEIAEAPEEEIGEEEKASGLRELVEEAAEQDQEDEAEEEKPKASKAIKGPGAFAWLAAILMMLFGLVMFIPSLCNAILAIPAISGLLAEAANQYQSAYEAYDFLAEIEPSIAQLGEAVFVPGSGAAPGYTTGNFIQERQLLSVSQQAGPMSQYTMQYFSMWFPEGTRVPRSLKMNSAVAQVVANMNEQLDTEDEDDVRYLNAVKAARKADTDKSHALLYDVLELYEYADQSLVSDELGERLDAIKNARGSKPWMYENIAFYRAIRMGDYDFVARQSADRLKRNGESYDSMLFQVKATYLTGDKKKAYELAVKYGENDVVANMMLLYTAELKYRDGDYGEAIALADEVAANAAGDPQLAQYVSEAAAYKAVALLLSGKAKEALAFLRQAVEENSEVSNNFISTLLAAAITAEDWEYYESFMDSQEMMMAQYVNGYSVPTVLEELKAGQTTLETIFIEGWGGFDA